MFNKIWSAIIESWNAFWETYETTYEQEYRIVLNGLDHSFAFNCFGDLCFPPFYSMPCYYQTQNEE